MQELDYQEKTIHDMALGEKAWVQKTFTDADVLMFAAVSLDVNPTHTNDEYAKKSIFGKRLVHGILTTGLISAVLGTKLPGPGCLYMKQESNFKAPVYIGDTIKAIVEVADLDYQKNRVRLRTYCVNQHGKTVLEGEAVMSLPKPRPNQVKIQTHSEALVAH